MDLRSARVFQRLPILRYVIALAAVLIAAMLNSGLWFVVDRPIASPVFLAAIAIATIVGGLRVGVFASLISGIAIDYFFVQPYYTFNGTQEELARLALFTLEGSFLSWMIERLRIATEQLSRSREELRELGQHQQTVREEEQKRIAVEIHDELGQALTGLKLEAHLIKKKINDETIDPGEVVAGLDRLANSIDGTISTVRRIASDLRPSILDDFGLVAAIEWQASDFEQKSGVECIFRSNAEEVELDGDAGSAVFRIFQEALTNVIRHAGASRVRISIDSLTDRFSLRVEDNGRGIDLERMTRVRSLGILGMRERAHRIGATVDVRRAVDGGTLVEVLLPTKTA